MRVLLATAAVASALRLQHIDVVLVGPQYASNVGQALRLCACFEVGRLKLVKPEYDRDADATYERRFAMPQGRAVRDARTTVHDTLDDALADVEFSVAFSGRGRANDKFAAAAPALASNNRRTALVFGREADGLRAEELARCGTSVEIDSADSLNLSHAVSIALADIYARTAESEPAAPDVAPDATVDALVARLGKALGADEGFRATSRGKVSCRCGNQRRVDGVKFAFHAGGRGSAPRGRAAGVATGRGDVRRSWGVARDPWGLLCLTCVCEKLPLTLVSYS